MPRVSVILPTRDRAGTLRRAIDSVLGQTFRDFELIVVDDGSTDGTLDLLSSYSDPRLRVHVNRGRHSAAAARNAGLRLALSPLIAFQDSDDEWLPRKLEVQIAALDALPEEVALVYGPMLQVRLDGTRGLLTPDRFTRSDADLFHKLQLVSMGIGIITVLLRRDALDAAGFFDENLRAREDWDLCLRIAVTRRFHYLPELFIHRYESEGSVSLDHEKVYDAMFAIFDKHRAEIESVPASLTAVQRNLGRALLASPRAAESRRWLWKVALSGGARPSDAFWLAVSYGGPGLYAALRALRNTVRRAAGRLSTSV